MQQITGSTIWSAEPTIDAVLDSLERAANRYLQIKEDEIGKI